MRSMCNLFKIFSILAISSQVYADDASTEEVYVSGSRLNQLELQTHLPILSIDKKALALNGDSLLSDSLNNLSVSGAPLTSQTTTNFGLFAAGTASIDLRSLSPNRTLVLLNGRRHVGGDSERPNVVDLNSIPTELIERIEIVTGGVSAIYGSEAVAGVVNIITKQDFEGVHFGTRYGQSSEGDGAEKYASLSVGESFMDGAGHISISASYTEVDEVLSKDRAFSRNDEFFGDFQDYSVYAPQGTLTADAILFLTADDSGSWTKEFNAVDDGFNRAEFELLQVPLTRQSIFLQSDYVFNSQLRTYLEASYVTTESFSQIEPTVAGVDLGHFLFSDNPFIPSEALTEIDTLYGFVPPDLYFTRRLTELGLQKSEQERTTQRFMSGLSGEFSEWQWDAYLQWGQNKREQNSKGHYNLFSFQNGLDVEPDPDNVGEYRCIDPQARAEGCVPINVFGENTISQAAIEYISIESKDESVIEQGVIALEVNGALPFFTNAGDLAVAFGFESRYESLETQVDEFALAGISSSNSVAAEIDDSYRVNEVFVETQLPFVADAGAVDSLSANIAARYADYSSVGGHLSWHVGLELGLSEQFIFRSNLASSVRAPNVVELYDPGVQTFVDFIDPCFFGGAGGPGNTEQNCTDLGIPADYDPDFLGTSSMGTVSGNEELQEEQADTFSFGFSFIGNEYVNVELSYFSIEIDDAIEFVDPQFKLSQCYAASDFPNSPFCEGISRDDASFNYLISNLDLNLQNIASLETDGWDLRINSRFPAFSGNITTNLLLTYTQSWESRVHGALNDRYEEPGFQKWKGNLSIGYEQERFGIKLFNRYLGSGVVDNSFEGVWQDNDLPEVWYHDLYASFAIENKASYVLFMGVDNITDKQPPYIPSPSINNIRGTATAAGVYDVVGRYFYAGLEARF